MSPTLLLDFDPYKADHRRVAEWLEAQADPAEAVVRLVRAAGEGERRLQQWEELATRLANEIQQIRAQMVAPAPAATPEREVHEDPQSARRLDTMFDQ